MTKTREKKVVHTGVTSEEMEQAFADYARANAREQKIKATMDLAITQIREKYQDELAKLSKEQEDKVEILQAYAMENKTVLFAKKKSMETSHGVFGFRTGTPKLKPLRGFTWNSILTMVKEFMPSYVRTVEEINKERLLADREDEAVSAQFAKVGISVVQDETFFVEAKKEE